MDDYTYLRQQMVTNQIHRRGVNDPNVLKAMNAVPRHEFVPLSYRHQSYDDTPLPIGYGQTISQPYMVAFMTQAAELKSSDVVMEIGAGCGYAAAVAACIAREVYSYEIVVPLAEDAKVRVASLGYKNLHIESGDGLKLSSGRGPFNAIIVTACATAVHEELKQRLAVHGRLIIPVEGAGGDFFGGQLLKRVTRTSEKAFKEEVLEYVRFVPLIENP